MTRMQVDDAMTASGGETGRRLLVIVAHDIGGRGGMEYVHAELIRRLAERYEITVVSNTLEPDLCRLARWQRVRVPRRPVPLKFLSFFLIAGLRLRSIEADLVHTCGAIVPNRATVATIHLCHAGVAEASGGFTPRQKSFLRRTNRGVKRLIALWAERWCYRPARLQIAHVASAAVGEQVRRHYPGMPVALIPFGLDTERYRADYEVRRHVRAAFDLSQQDLVVLFVGGDWGPKGLAVAIDALALARSKHPELRLWVAGHGDVARYSAHARDRGVANAVKFHGDRDDVAPLYQAADMFVLPSEYEGFSLASYEASACGLPVIATSVGRVPELVGSGEAGILAERDPESFAEAIGQLAGDPALRGRMGERGRATVERLGWVQATDAMDSLYGSLARMRSASWRRR